MNLELLPAASATGKTRYTNPACGVWNPLDESEQASAMAFNSTGTLFAVGGKHGRVAIWDTSTLRTVIKILEPQEEQTSSSSISDDDNKNESSLLTQEEQQAIDCVKDVTAIAWSIKSRFIWTGCWDPRAKEGRVCVWDVESGRIKSTIVVVNDGKVLSVTPHPTIVTQAIVSCVDHEPVLIDFTTNSRIEIPFEKNAKAFLNNNDDNINFGKTRVVYTKVLFSFDQLQLYCVNTRGYVGILDAQTFNALHVVVVQGIVTPELRVTTTSDKHNTVWGIIPTLKGIRGYNFVEANDILHESREKIAPLGQNYLYGIGSVKSSWSNCAFTPDGQYVVGVPTARHVQVGEKGLYSWEASTGVVSDAVDSIKGGLGAIEMHPTQAYLMAITNTGNVAVLEEPYNSTWAGRMFPPRYRLITDNVRYVEPSSTSSEEEQPSAADAMDVEDNKISSFIDVVTPLNPSLGGIQEWDWLVSTPIETSEDDHALLNEEQQHFTGSIFRMTTQNNNSTSPIK